ncbi:transcription factor A, mitochondrial [Monodelphis domestica]|uniref:transcription factor A, mitochondrial n=1 Tax=Monodelphis domestica TaxID=13616 RepID=UPI0004434715|nr:transcription factor A, mitochondrial [Monodelphis domestica]
MAAGAAALLRGGWRALRALDRPAALRAAAGIDRGLLGPPLPSSICALERFMKDCTLSNVPKKPLTSYIRFVMDRQPQFKEQNPDLKNTEVIRMLAQVWRELPASEKKVYEDATKADFKLYQEQVSKYKAELKVGEKRNLKVERRRKKARKEIVKKKRELTVFGKPKRPRSGYNIFISENFKESRGLPAQEMLKILNKEWKNLSSSRKQVYMQLAEDDKIRYTNEIKSWEEKMIEIGREDLLRFRKLKDKIGKGLEDIY